MNIKSGVAALLIAVSFPLASPMTAHADDPPWDDATTAFCGGNRVCLFEDTHFMGDKYVEYEPGTVSGNRFEIHGWDGDNEISSLVNTTSKAIVLYDGDNFAGATVCIPPYKQVRRLGDKPLYFNDKAESFTLTDRC